MNVLEAIAHRHSARAFLDKPVPRALLEDLLTRAARAPSGANTQPWQVVVLGPQTMQAVKAALIHARTIGQVENPDYHYYPTQWRDPYKARRFACGQALYQAVGIAQQDKAARAANWNANYAFFGAPVALLFFLDADLEKGSWLDMGLFLENLMLAAVGMGLDTCAQASLADYPDIIRDITKVPASKHLVCGMALGYADPHAPVNQYRTAREPLDNFVQWCV